jgi:hypothetical protein
MYFYFIFSFVLYSFVWVHSLLKKFFSLLCWVVIHCGICKGSYCVSNEIRTFNFSQWLYNAENRKKACLQGTWMIPFHFFTCTFLLPLLQSRYKSIPSPQSSPSCYLLICPLSTRSIFVTLSLRHYCIDGIL